MLEGVVLTYQCPVLDAQESRATICMAASLQLAFCCSMAVPTWRIMLYKGRAWPSMSGWSDRDDAATDDGAPNETAAASVCKSAAWM